MLLLLIIMSSPMPLNPNNRPKDIAISQGSNQAFSAVSNFNTTFNPPSRPSTNNLIRLLPQEMLEMIFNLASLSSKDLVLVCQDFYSLSSPLRFSTLHLSDPFDENLSQKTQWIQANPSIRKRIHTLVVDFEDAANESPIAKRVFALVTSLPNVARLSIRKFGAKDTNRYSAKSMNKQATKLYSTRWLTLFQTTGKKLEVLDIGFLPFVCLPELTMKLKEINLYSKEVGFHLGNYRELLGEQVTRLDGEDEVILYSVIRRCMILASNYLATDQGIMATLRFQTDQLKKELLCFLHIWFKKGRSTARNSSLMVISINPSQ